MAAVLLSKYKNTLQDKLRQNLNNTPSSSLRVVGLTSHMSFFMQLHMFSIGFTSGDCEGISILRLELFSNHANTAMAL